MRTIKYIPLYILALLLAILVFLEAWTYYLGRPSVTFERYLGKPVPAVVEDLGLRRYRAEHSPHLFDIKVSKENEKQLIDEMVRQCHMQKISAKRLPKAVAKVDTEMVDVIKLSPYIYMTAKYNEANVTAHRLCILFRDDKRLYLYLNGDL